jgi:hypothetical protein
MVKEEREQGSLTNAPRELNEIATLALTAIKEFKEAMVNNQIASPVDPDDAEHVKVNKPSPKKEGNLVISPPRGLLVPGQSGPYDMAISKGEYTPGRGWVGSNGEQVDKGKLSEFVFGEDPLAITGPSPHVEEDEVDKNGPEPSDDVERRRPERTSLGEFLDTEDIDKGILGLQIGEGDPDADVIAETLKNLATELARTLKVINEQKMTQRIPSPTAHQPGDMRPGNDRDQPNYPEGKE